MGIYLLGLDLVFGGGSVIRNKSGSQKIPEPDLAAVTSLCGRHYNPVRFSRNDLIRPNFRYELQFRLK